MIITKETTFNQLPEKQREGLAKGFKIHMAKFADIEDLTVRDIFNLLATANAKVIFFRRNGRDQFKLQINQKRFLMDFLSDRMIIPNKI